MSSPTHPTLHTTGAGAVPTGQGPGGQPDRIRPFEIHVPQVQANVEPVKARVMHAVTMLSDPEDVLQLFETAAEAVRATN
jgi:hypothetical protein